jgi:hypothetical protein
LPELVAATPANRKKKLVMEGNLMKESPLFAGALPVNYCRSERKSLPL